MIKSRALGNVECTLHWDSKCRNTVSMNTHIGYVFYDLSYMEEHPNQNLRKKITCKNFMPRQVSSVPEVYTASTLLIATLQVHSPLPPKKKYIQPYLLPLVVHTTSALPVATLQIHCYLKKFMQC